MRDGEKWIWKRVIAVAIVAMAMAAKAIIG